MQCDEFEQRLQLVLDQRREPREDDLLTAHARQCAECERVLRVQSRLFAALPLVRIPNLSSDFAPGVLQQFNYERRRAFRIRLAAWSLAAAAVLVLCFLPWLRPNTDVVFSSHTNSGGHTLGLATMSADAVQGHAKLHSTQDFAAMSAEELHSFVRQLVAQLADPNSARESVNQLAVTIRPLAVTFNVAVDTLLRTLPGHHDPDSDAPKTTQFHLTPIRYG